MITPQIILSIKPRHPSATVTAAKFEVARLRFGITDPRSVAALLANCSVESGLVPQRENGYYRNPARLRDVFPSFFNPTRGGKADPAQYLRDPEKLFNFVYANRRGNGDVASGDGYRFRGGGDIQNTFHDGYFATGKEIGFDLVAHPELIEQIGVSALAACAYWARLSSANTFAMRGAISATRRAVNGPAMLHLDEMLATYNRVLPLLH